MSNLVRRSIVSILPTLDVMVNSRLAYTFTQVYLIKQSLNVILFC